MTDQCNTCRFWKEDMAVRDPNDPDFGFGACRLAPPKLVNCLVDAQLEKPRWGTGDVPDDIVDTIELTRASRHPTTFATDWCGAFNYAPASADLIAELDKARARAWMASEDDEASASVDQLYSVAGRIRTLPNTRENLAARALAILATVSYTSNASEMDLLELSSHAETTAGELVRDILACLLDQVPA